MTAKEHNKLLGIFLMAHGVLQALGIVIVALVYGGLGAAMLANARRSEEQMMGGVFLVMLVVLLIVGAAFVIPQLLGGWKVLKEAPSARTWGIVASIIALLSFPLGTAAGIYGLWFLFGEEGKRFYLSGANQQNLFNQPPPNNWQ